MLRPVAVLADGVAREAELVERNVEMLGELCVRASVAQP
jgi:hypothetical protein